MSGPIDPTNVEERLRAALQARAELVGPEDLEPAALPAPAPTTPWWRRPEVYLSVAAVLVLVLAIPLLSRGLSGDSDAPQPAGTSDATEGVDRPPHMEADIDGDGTPDEVRVVTVDAAEPLYVVEVTFADGTTRSWYGAGTSPVELADNIDLDTVVGGDELLVNVGSNPSVLVVLGAGANDRLDVVHDRRIRSGTAEGGHVYDWWVEDGAIRRTQSLRPIPDGATAYAVQVVDWVFDDGGVDRRLVGELCVNADDPRGLAGCDEITPDPGLR